MADVDGVSTSTKTTATGQQYTAGISNDGLTNEDFLKTSIL